MFEKITYTLLGVILFATVLQISIPLHNSDNMEARAPFFNKPDQQESAELVTQADIEESLSLVADRLHQDTKDDGTFNYMYYPSDAEYSDDYNIIRHILAANTLIDLYTTYQDPTYIEDAKNSIDFFLNYLVKENDMSYITYDGRTKLGAAGTAVTTLLHYQEVTNTKEYQSTIIELGEFIIYMQNEDGGYNNYYPDPDPDNRLATVLYTGEADLALIELYTDTGDQQYLDALDRSYEWTKTYFEERHSPGLVSWTSSAFAKSYYATGDAKYADLAFEMTDWLIDKTQYTKANAPSEEYIGSFIINDVENGLTCTVAAYGEGITDMIKLAKTIGDTEHEEKYINSLNAGLGFMLSMQYTDDSDPNAQGAFKASMYKDHTRIDFNTHAATTLIKTLENGIY